MAMPTLPAPGNTRYSVRQAALSRATTACTSGARSHPKPLRSRPDTPNARRPSARRDRAHLWSGPTGIAVASVLRPY